MEREIRLDRGRLAKARRTGHGFVRCDSRITRTGILEYLRADGSVQRELRPEDEVFRVDSLETLDGVPVTDMHPSVMIDSTNATALSRGHVCAARVDGNFIAAELQVEDRELIAKIDAGERVELSCGYDCEFEPTPGIWRGQRYDGIQRRIRYNHVALLPAGFARAGSEVALRLDSADAPAHVLVSHFDSEDDATEIARNEMIARNRTLAHMPSSTSAPSDPAPAAKLDATDNDPARARAEMIERNRRAAFQKVCS